MTSTTPLDNAAMVATRRSLAKLHDKSERRECDNDVNMDMAVCKLLIDISKAEVWQVLRESEEVRRAMALLVHEKDAVKVRKTRERLAFALRTRFALTCEMEMIGDVLEEADPSVGDLTLAERFEPTHAWEAAHEVPDEVLESVGVTREAWDVLTKEGGACVATLLIGGSLAVGVEDGEECMGQAFKDAVLELCVGLGHVALKMHVGCEEIRACFERLESEIEDEDAGRMLEMVQKREECNLVVGAEEWENVVDTFTAQLYVEVAERESKNVPEEMVSADPVLLTGGRVVGLLKGMMVGRGGKVAEARDVEMVGGDKVAPVSEEAMEKASEVMGRPGRLVMEDVGGLVAAAAANAALAAASAAVSGTPPAEDVEMEVAYQPVLESFVDVVYGEPTNADTVHRSIEWLKELSMPELCALPRFIEDLPFEPHEYICHPRKPLARLPLEGADEAAFKYAMVDLIKTKHSNAGRKSKSSAKPDASSAGRKSPPTRKTNSSSVSQEDLLQERLDFCNVTKVFAAPEAKMSLLFVQHPMRYPNITAPYYFPVAPYIIPEQPVVLANSPMYCTGRPELSRAVRGGRSSQNIRSAPHPMVPDPKYLVKPSNQCGEDCKVRDPDDPDRFYMFTRCVCVITTFNENHEVVQQIGPANFRFTNQRITKPDSRRRTTTTRSRPGSSATKKRPLPSSPSAGSNTSHSSTDSNPAASAPPPVLRWSSSSRVLSNTSSDVDMLALDTPPAAQATATALPPARDAPHLPPAAFPGSPQPTKRARFEESPNINDELRSFFLQMQVPHGDLQPPLDTSPPLLPQLLTPPLQPLNPSTPTRDPDGDDPMDG